MALTKACRRANSDDSVRCIASPPGVELVHLGENPLNKATGTGSSDQTVCNLRVAY